PPDLSSTSSGFRGYFRLGDLPFATHRKLRARQRGKGVVQIRIPQDSIVLNLLFALVLPGWFVFLFYISTDETWTTYGWAWYSEISLVIACIFGANAVAITRFFRATFTPAFYVTPLYFIKTDFDLLGYWPITSLRDIDTTHRLKNGQYKDPEGRLR